MKNKKPSISIFFPFLNDWGTVGSLIGLAVSTVSKLTDDWEILIINDGSKKEDREALEMIVNVISKYSPGRSPLQGKPYGHLPGAVKIELKKAIKTPRMVAGKRENARHDSSEVEGNRIKIIHHEKNRGYGGALRSGFENAKKDLIFYTDCDAQYDPRELEKLFEAMMPAFVPIKSRLRRGEVGMVNGYKIKRNDPWIRIIAGRIYHHAVKFAFRLPIRDTDCDFRLIRREVFDRVRLFESTGTICTELVKKIDYHGYKIAEVPVHHFWRTSGKSQFFNFSRLAKTGVNLLRLWWKLMIKKEFYQ